MTAMVVLDHRDRAAGPPPWGEYARVLLDVVVPHCCPKAAGTIVASVDRFALWCGRERLEAAAVLLAAGEAQARALLAAWRLDLIAERSLGWRARGEAIDSLLLCTCLAQRYRLIEWQLVDLSQPTSLRRRNGQGRRR